MLVLHRYPNNVKATRSYSDNLGVRFEFLEPAGDPSCKTMSNKPIPKGIYTLGKHERGFILNTTCSRKGILIHSGNTVRDTKGCLLPGLKGDEENVYNSKLAIKILRKLLKEGDKIVIL